MTILLIICSTISTLYYIYVIKESSIYDNLHNSIDTKYQYVYNNYINGNSVSYMISVLTLITLLNGVQIINIIKGAFIIGISVINII
jgi:hypothetical protein